MLSINGINKSYGGRVLFADASLRVNRGERIGLVGPNGAGKSTLFAMVLRREEPDTGDVVLERGVSLGYLPQENQPVAGETNLQIATGLGPDDHGSTPEHFQLQARAKKILQGLSFRPTDFERPACEMSGGWVMRAHLARLLVQEPDLLMLDEPTNHLDLESLLWLQDYLKAYPGAILLISHDREFLNQLVGSIVEIRQSRLVRYRGNYDDYLEQREAQYEQLLAAHKNQQREIAHLMRFVERFRAKNTKASQAQSKLKQIDRMEKIELPDDSTPEIDFRFPQPQRSGLKVITLRNIHHAYGSNVVYDRMEFQVERGQRIVLVGPNGAGKSTLLKLLAGVLPLQRGERVLGHNVRSGYYAQYRVDMLHPECTVLEEALDTPQRVTEQFVRTVLGCFLFRGDDVFKRVAVLSGGEKSRLALVKLLLDPPNLLLMDEPTTHLDMPGISALAAALDQFEGTLIFISHDVHFIRTLANHVVHVKDGRLRHYPGGYDYYVEKSAADALPSRLETPARSEANLTLTAKEQRRLEAEQRQARSRQRRQQQEITDRLEAEIEALEQRQTALTAELEAPQTYSTNGRVVAINRELADIHARLPELTAQWEQAAHKLHLLQ
ncbi:MAG: ABC-F family ATP-binding cassette domain-containing protein [Verrucomicrobia subdivision 3 bacterium]|nr:ABC-F family ATP-binding cassette domain-containing protein [Limisphaerales bacterium]